MRRRASVELLSQSGIGDLDALSAQIFIDFRGGDGRSDPAACRWALRNEGILDGFDEPLQIKVKMTVKNGEIEYDFAGTPRKSAKE